MDRQSLLAELEHLNDSGRMRRMVEVGRQARTDPRAAAALAEMARGRFYERRLAVQACAGSGDREHVLRAVDDPSALIAGLALHLLPMVATDADATELLRKLPARRRKRLVKGLWRQGRREAVQAHVDWLAGRNDHAGVSALLAYVSEAQARAHVEKHGDRMSDADWRQVARRFPKLAGEAMRKRLESATQSDPRLAWQAKGVLEELGTRDPNAALSLVKPANRHAPLEALNLQPLTMRRPNQVVDLVLASDERTDLRLGFVADRLDAQRLRSLLTRRPRDVGDEERWLRRLPPGRRAEAWAAAEGKWRHADGSVDLSVLNRMPTSVRHAEGRKHLALPDLLAGPATRRLPYASLLPWDEARKTLDSFLKSADADERAAAQAALVGAARFHADKLGEVLRFLLDRPNEQDPVRQRALEALAELPPSRWKPEHLVDLGRLVQGTLEAADVSPTSAAAAERLVVAVLPFHPKWAARWLATLAADRGSVTFQGLDHKLTDEQVRELAPTLAEVFEAWEQKERGDEILTAARSVGRRLAAFDALSDRLENLIYETQDNHGAESALRLLMEFRKDRFRRVVPALLAKDPSWVTRPVVHDHLHRSQQDLLTPFLGRRRTFTGRFSTGRNKYLVPFRDGFERWTAAQQRAFEYTLRDFIGTKGRETPAVLYAIRQLAALPDVDVGRLVELAERIDVKRGVRDTALRALGRVEGGRGVPVLVNALKDKHRGKVAIYALRRSLLALPPGQALATLKEVPTGAVTVEKEVVRLLGELGTLEAFAELLARNKLDPHRDVRAALLRAMWGYLERKHAWELLAEAVRSPEPALASVAIRTPANRLSADAQALLAGLLAEALGHPEPQVRLATLRRCEELPISDPGRVLLPKLLEGIGSEVRAESAAAAKAVFATYAGAESAGTVAEAISKLLLNRRALKTAVTALEDTTDKGASRVLPTVRAVLKAMEPDRLTVNLRVRLGASALPPAEIGTMLGRLVDHGLLHADAVSAALHAIRSYRGAARAEHWEYLEKVLVRSPDDRIRRVALEALIAAARASDGWTEARKSRLQAYASDTSPLVSAAAAFTFPKGGDVAGGMDFVDDLMDLL